MAVYPVAFGIWNQFSSCNFLSFDSIEFEHWNVVGKMNAPKFQCSFFYERKSVYGTYRFWQMPVAVVTVGHSRRWPYPIRPEWNLLMVRASRKSRFGQRFIHVLPPLAGIHQSKIKIYAGKERAKETNKRIDDQTQNVKLANESNEDDDDQDGRAVF